MKFDMNSVNTNWRRNSMWTKNGIVSRFYFTVSTVFSRTHYLLTWTKTFSLILFSYTSSEVSYHTAVLFYYWGMPLSLFVLTHYYLELSFFIVLFRSSLRTLVFNKLWAARTWTESEPSTCSIEDIGTISRSPSRQRTLSASQNTPFMAPTCNSVNFFSTTLSSPSYPHTANSFLHIPTMDTPRFLRFPHLWRTKLLQRPHMGDPR